MSTIEADRNIIKKVKKHLAHKPSYIRQRRECDGLVEKVVPGPLNREKKTYQTWCSRKKSEERVWGNHRLHFCKQCAEEWDNVMTWALTDFYIERGLVPDEQMKGN